MTDEPPATPRRSKRKGAKKQEAMVPVMADIEPEAEPDLPGAAAADNPGAAGEADATERPAAEAATDAGTADEPAEEPGDAEAADAPVILRVERGGLGEVTAGQVEVSVGGIGALDAEEVHVQWGGIGAARAEHVTVEMGGIGAVLAGDARISQGGAGSVVAREVVLDQAFARTVIAQRVTANKPTGVLVLIAQQVSGDVRPLLDWRAAIAAGVAFGIVTAVLRALRGRT